jgi:hypothetical protein
MRSTIRKIYGSMEGTQPESKVKYTHTTKKQEINDTGVESITRGYTSLRIDKERVTKPSIG